ACRTHAIPIHVARRCNSTTERLSDDTSSVKKCLIHRCLILLALCCSSDWAGRVNTACCSIYSRVSPAFSTLPGINASYLPLKVPKRATPFLHIRWVYPQGPSIPIRTTKSPTSHRIALLDLLEFAHTLGIYCLVVYYIKWLPGRLLESSF